MKNEVTLEYGTSLDNEDLVSLFWDCYKASKQRFEPWWKEGAELYRMYGSGDGLLEVDRQNLLATGREPISFPYSTGTINAIVGSDQADRKESLFRGKDGGMKDEWLADAYSTLVRHAMNQSNGHRAESDAFLDMLITGYGFCEAYLDTAFVPMKTPVKRVNYWEMWPDPDATEDNLSDSSFIIRERMWKLEEVQARWPGKALELEESSARTWTPSLQATNSVEGSWRNVSRLQRDKRVRVLDFQYARYEPRVVWYDPTTGERMDTAPGDLEARRGQMQEEFDAQVDAFSAQVEEMALMEDPLAAVPVVEPPTPPAPIEEFSYAGKVYYRALIALGQNSKNGGVVLEHKQMSMAQFSYNAVTGYKEKNGEEGYVRFFGPMRTLFHAQLYLNKSLRVYLEIMERGAKGGGTVEESAVIDGDKAAFLLRRSTPGQWDFVADGAHAARAIDYAPVQSVPQGWESFMKMCVDAISSLTGVTEWWKGTATQERSNVLVTNLQERNSIMLNPLFEPMTDLRKKNGFLLAQIFNKHVPDSDINRILGDAEVEGLTHEPAIDPMTGAPQKDPMTGKKILRPIFGADGMPVTKAKLIKEADVLAFDITVDTGQATPTQKQAVWQVFTQTGLLQSLIELSQGLSVPFMDILLPALMRYLPIPAEMARGIADQLESRLGQSDALKTQEGIMQALAGLPPEQVQQVVMQAVQMMQQQPQQPEMVA